MAYFSLLIAEMMQRLLMFRPRAAGTHSADDDTDETFVCPICRKPFDDDAKLVPLQIRGHVVLPLDGPGFCPVCGHIIQNEISTEASYLRTADDHLAGTSSTSEQRDAPPQRDPRNFDLGSAQTRNGMSNLGNFCDQAVANMQRAVYAGEMSVEDYYDRTMHLHTAERYGVDDCSSVTRNVVPLIFTASSSEPHVARTLTCSCVDHFASTYGDYGWGCGYRNAQMLISALLGHPRFNDRINRVYKDRPPFGSMPSITQLQRMVEQAWSQGFDKEGSEQLGNQLVNTRKWIGASEVVTLFSFLGIRCQLLDFYQPTGDPGAHVQLFNWVLNYFESGKDDFVPPLYLQHHGHSRTIMGVEVEQDGTLVLLVLDPSHSPQQMAMLHQPTAAGATLSLLRQRPSALNARQYQILAIVGTIDSPEQYEQCKLLNGLYLP